VIKQATVDVQQASCAAPRCDTGLCGFAKAVICDDAHGHCEENDIEPKVKCVCRLNEDEVYAQFSYFNSHNASVTLAAGTFRNYMTPGALNQ